MPVYKQTRGGKWTGKWIADVQDARAGIPRTRPAFNTKKEALEYEAHIRKEGEAALLGKRKQYTFGEALKRYMEEIGPYKKSFESEISKIAALRWPIWYENRWISLEHTPLEPRGGQLSIVPAMAAWAADMRGILKRSRINNEIYHQRKTPNGSKWYLQPPTKPRMEIKDKALLIRLDAADSQGPYSNDTLRLRQAVVKTILGHAWRRWDWIGSDLGDKIITEKPAPHRRQFLTADQAQALIQAARATEYGDHLADAILGAVLIGWRRSNVLGLRWTSIHWPTAHAIGYLDMPGSETKTDNALGQPMSQQLETLLRRRQKLTQGAAGLVFHRGDGKPFGDFRKTWVKVKAQAGISDSIRWHDLRHTWASWLIQAGATDRQLMELGGWTSANMPKTYAHLRTHDLAPVVELLPELGGKTHD